MPQSKLISSPNQAAPDPSERGVPLSAYAAVMALASEGITLGESLSRAGIDATLWEAAEEAWLLRIASADQALLDALSQHWGAALSALRSAAPEEQGAEKPLTSLAETALAFKVDKPALPFTEPTPGAPPPVFEERPAPEPAASLGETKLAFVVDKPALPFARPAEPQPSPSPLPELSVTLPAFKVDAPALPFEQKSAEPPLAETAPAFKVDKPVLPFDGQGSDARVKAFVPVETAPVLRVDLKALPFAKSAAEPAPKALPEPRLSLEAYAAMCAEMWLYPARTAAIAARHGFTPETKANEDAAWQGRFADNQALKTAWERLAIEAGARMRGAK